MSKIERKNKTDSFAKRVQEWSGVFEGDSRVVVGEVIAAYYNGSAIEDSIFDVVKQRARLSRATTGTSGLALIAEVLLIESHFHFPLGQAREGAVADLVRQRPKFCEALRWLCSPKTAAPAIPPHELEALAASGKLDWGRYPEIDHDSELFVAYFEDHGVKHFKRHLYLRDGQLCSIWLPAHLIDLFCVFLLAECEGKTPLQMPLKFCGKCNKLLFTDLEGKARERKQFCSSSCQEGRHWTRTPHARSDSGFVDRLLENTGADLRKRLAKPEVRTRLAEIKSEWQSWETLMDKLKEIESLAK